VRRVSASRFAAKLLLLACALAFVAPILIVVATSLKTMPEIQNGSIFALPAHPNLAAWNKAWGTACIAGRCSGLAANFANSFAIAIPALLLSLVLGATTGFALSLRASRHADLLFKFLLVGMFIPVQVTLFPMIMFERELGLFGSRAGAIVAHLVWGLPFTTMLFRNFFLGLSRSVLDAARIDGAGFFALLCRIVLPMSWPIISVAAALQFTFLWNEFLLNLTFAGSGNEPVNVALNILSGAQFETQEYNVNMAAAIITALPTIVVFMFSGQIFLRGITTGPTKGKHA
jgi:glucose/mannose transport system permease protein